MSPTEQAEWCITLRQTASMGTSATFSVELQRTDPGTSRGVVYRIATPASVAAMGRTIGWTAVRGATLDEVAQGLGCQRATDREGSIRIAELPSGWILIDSSGHPPVGEVEVKRLSAGRQAVIFEASERSVTSFLTCFRNGTRAWKICNDVDEPGEVVIIGEADPVVVEEAQIAATLQQGVHPDEDGEVVSHAYEAIAIVAERLTGYNVDLATGELTWVNLVRPVAPIRRSLTNDGGNEVNDATLEAVQAALSAFVSDLHERASVKLAVIRDGKRFTLRASVEDGALHVVALGNGRMLVRRKDGSALSTADLSALFASYYASGERSATYSWVTN